MQGWTSWMRSLLDAPGIVSRKMLLLPPIEDSLYKVSEASHIFCMAETKAGSVPLVAIQVSMASTRDTWSPEKLSFTSNNCATARSLHACPCTASLSLSSRDIRSSTARATSLGRSVSILIDLYASKQESRDQVWARRLQKLLSGARVYGLINMRASHSLTCKISTSLLICPASVIKWQAKKAAEHAKHANQQVQCC